MSSEFCITSQLKQNYLSKHYSKCYFYCLIKTMEWKILCPNKKFQTSPEFGPWDHNFILYFILQIHWYWFKSSLVSYEGMITIFNKMFSFCNKKYFIIKQTIHWLDPNYISIIFISSRNLVLKTFFVLNLVWQLMAQFWFFGHPGSFWMCFYI
jgi:hypothetical protein